MLDMEWLVFAINTVQKGLADKLEKEGTIVYRCGKIVRVDIKNTLEVK